MLRGAWCSWYILEEGGWDGWEEGWGNPKPHHPEMHPQAQCSDLQHNGLIVLEGCRPGRLSHVPRASTALGKGQQLQLLQV